MEPGFECCPFSGPLLINDGTNRIRVTFWAPYALSVGATEAVSL